MYIINKSLQVNLLSDILIIFSDIILHDSSLSRVVVFSAVIIKDFTIHVLKTNPQYDSVIICVARSHSKVGVTQDFEIANHQQVNVSRFREAGNNEEIEKGMAI